MAVLPVWVAAIIGDQKSLGMLFYYWLISAQIVLESFPISSSTHVVLLKKILLCDYNALLATARSTCDRLSMTFNIDVIDHFLHGPTALIVALFFRKRWFFLLHNIGRCWRIIIKIMVYTFSADVVTTVLFCVLHGNHYPFWMIGPGLLITSLSLLSLQWCPASSRSTLTWARACLLGCVQGLAFLPGISRLASTYVAARWLRLPHAKAFEISLLIQWPLIVVSFLNSVRVLGFSCIRAHFLNLEVVFVILSSSIMAWLGLHVVAYLLRSDRAWWFAWYIMIPLGTWASFIIRG